MIEKLLHWQVKNRNVARLGRRVEEINKEFAILDQSLMHGMYQGIVNMHRARSLGNKIEGLRKQTARLAPKDRFDKLVLREYVDSLFTQLEYIKFFFTKQYNKDWGVKAFLNYAFFPEEEFRGKEDENGAMNFLENILRNIQYSEQTKRENLMQEMNTYEHVCGPQEYDNLVLAQLPRLRGLMADYNVDMGFETPEQRDKQDLLEQQKEIEQAEALLRQQLHPLEDISKFVVEQQRIKFRSIMDRKVGMDEPLTNLMYGLVFSHDDYAAWNDAVRTIEVNSGRFLFYKDRKGKTRCFTADIDRTMSHENFHRLQTYFSRFMPQGLQGAPGELNITGRTIMEGTAMVLEENFMEWLDKNRRKYRMSAKDVKIASLEGHSYVGNRVIRLLHSVYSRELSSAEGKDHYVAHEKLAAVSKVPVLADEDFLADESVIETFYFSYYLFGRQKVRTGDT